MLMRQVFALLVLLLFFWYVSGSSGPGVVRPTAPRPTADPDNSYTFHPSGDSYQYSFSGHVWSTDVPDGYHILSQEIRPKDPCYTVRDHGKVVATGPLLYEYLQKERLQSGPHRSIEIDASSAFQDRKVFYFECLNKEILKLHQCPSGHVFRNNDCLPVSICLDQPDGTQFPDPTDPKYYYRCLQSRLERKQCVQSWFFDYNQCQMASFQYFCQHNAFQMLNEKTLLVCDRGRATFETCPPRTRYFENPLSAEKPVCESDACVGVPDGQKKSLPMKMKRGLVYTPGYLICEKDRVRQRVECSREWDTFSIDHQLPLPLVFDMARQECAAPKLCENVDVQNSDIVVPVQEWTHQLPLWKYASLMDQVTGYTCDAPGSRKRVPAPAGYWVGRHHKMESACLESTRTVVPVSGRPGLYYSCLEQRTKTCERGHFFNGEACQRYTLHAFQYQRMDVYSMNALDWDFWIKPLEHKVMSYSDKALRSQCVSPFRYDQAYNICAHEECALYPFLSQIDFLIGLRDGSTCQYNATTRHLEKVDPVADEKYLYWAQRTTHDSSSVNSEPCHEGQTLQSGHFVFDRTIFATCDPQQPFVFCPSPLTLGIEKRHGVFTCKPKDHLLARATIPAGRMQVFAAHILHEVSSRTDAQVKINGYAYKLDANTPLDLTPIQSQPTSNFEMKIEALDAALTVHYAVRNTHPPHVTRFYRDGKFKEAKVDKDGNVHLIKHDQSPDLTKGFNINFVTYSPVPLLPQLEL